MGKEKMRSILHLAVSFEMDSNGYIEVVSQKTEELVFAGFIEGTPADNSQILADALARYVKLQLQKPIVPT